MNIQMTWTPAKGTLDVRSRWADASRGSYTVHAKGIDLSLGRKTFIRDEEGDEHVQVRRNGGAWIDVGVISGDAVLKL